MKPGRDKLILSSASGTSPCRARPNQIENRPPQGFDAFKIMTLLAIMLFLRANTHLHRVAPPRAPPGTPPRAGPISGGDSTRKNSPTHAQKVPLVQRGPSDWSHPLRPPARQPALSRPTIRRPARPIRFLPRKSRRGQASCLDKGGLRMSFFRGTALRRRKEKEERLRRRIPKCWCDRRDA